MQREGDAAGRLLEDARSDTLASFFAAGAPVLSICRALLPADPEVAKMAQTCFDAAPIGFWLAFFAELNRLGSGWLGWSAADT